MAVNRGVTHGRPNADGSRHVSALLELLLSSRGVAVVPERTAGKHGNGVRSLAVCAVCAVSVAAGVPERAHPPRPAL